MFKSIEYITCTYNNKTDKYNYYYHLKDSDFECDISVSAPSLVRAEVVAGATEYHKRGLDVVKNIYLLNLYLQKGRYSNLSFIQILDYQNKYIDKYCPIDGISFSEDIYPKVKELYETLNNYL